MSLARQRVVWFWNAVSVGLDDVKEKDSWLPPPTPLTADRCSMITFSVHGAIRWAVSRAINLLRFWRLYLLRNAMANRTTKAKTIKPSTDARIITTF